MSEIINLKNKIDDILKKKIKEFQLKNIAIDIVKNNKNEYYLILEKEKYLASLIISEPIFAPYKNICFEVYRVSDEKIILFYYDNENMEECKLSEIGKLYVENIKNRRK